MRSTTWSMLEACAFVRSGITLRISTVPTIFHARIYPPSVSKLKDDVCDGRKIHRMPLLQSRLEANLLCGVKSGFVQSVTQSLHYANRPYLPRRKEVHFDQHFAFDSQLPRLIRIGGVWLGQNHHRLNRGFFDVL